FGDSLGGIIGNPLTFLNFRNVGAAPHPEIGAGLPFLLFALFQLKFAIITPALFTGSMAGRIRFRSYILFMVLFTLFIYAPLAHMTWHPDGLLMNLGVLDFAGGTVVHMSAGFAALAGAVHLGPRNIDRLEHANIPFIILGTGLLWFGWFGFNAGSALGANDDAVLALANTHFASAAGMITWMFYERYKGRKMNAVGACIGAIVGLVAITPAAGFVTVQESVAIGFIAAVVSNWAIARQSKSGLDDTLDVFPSHGVGGMVGMVLTGVFAADVGLTSGETDTFLWHLVALVGVAIFTFGASLLLFKLVDKAIPLRVTGWQETLGLDESQHGETVD
ncbi:MAG: ammonium transporter, partial [Flavobacteriales bacterium]